MTFSTWLIYQAPLPMWLSRLLYRLRYRMMLLRNRLDRPRRDRIERARRHAQAVRNAASPGRETDLDVPCVSDGEQRARTWRA